MRGQVFDLKYASTDGNNLAASALRSAHVFGRVSNKTNLRCRTEPAGNLLHPLSENVDSQFKLVREASEREIVGEAGGFDLQPGHGFQIA